MTDTFMGCIYFGSLYRLHTHISAAFLDRIFIPFISRVTKTSHSPALGHQPSRTLRGKEKETELQ